MPSSSEKQQNPVTPGSFYWDPVLPAFEGVKYSELQNKDPVLPAFEGVKYSELRNKEGGMGSFKFN